MQWAARADVSGGTEGGTLSTSENMGTFFVFDGAVTLISALAYAPEHPSARQCIEMVERAMEILQEAGKVDGQGEVAHRATEVLNVLRRAGGWTGKREDGQHLDPSQQQSGTNSRGSRIYRDPPNSVSEKSSAAGTTSSQAYSHSISHTRPQPTSQPHSSFPFLAPSNISSKSNPFGFVSAPTVAPSHMPAGNGEFTGQADSGGVWAGVGGMNSRNHGGISDMDVHMMMPFAMLQGMPLNEDWRGF
jgi:hypothetical protein